MKLKVVSKNSNLYNDVQVIEFINSYNCLLKRYGHKKIIMKSIGSDILIPINLFSFKSRCLEVIIKYLIDEKKMDFETVSIALNRNIKIIKKAYNKSLTHNFCNIKTLNNTLSVPLLIFRNRSLSLLEHLVKYLKEVHNLRFSEIALLINRNQRTIWTVYNRANNKR